jgi:serine/threonine protein kinase
MESLIPTVAGTNPSMTATLNNASSVSNQTQTKASSETTSLAIGGVSTIDGIPFYRYTRYQSEFHEKMQLGEGGFGTVFKCINTLDKREYAVKKVLLRSGVGSNGHLPEQFTQKLHRVLREVKILALLDHPNIVRYCTAWLELELSEDDGEFPTKAKNFSRGFSSEYLVGSTLGGESFSPTRGSSKNHLHRSIFEARDAKENPLQWNDFSFLDSDQLDISTQRKLEARESSSSLLSGSDDDIGFSWERSPIASSRHHTHIKKSDGLTTIEDRSINLSEDESNSSSSNPGSSSSNGSDVESNTNWSDCDSNVVTPPSEEKTDSSYQQNKGNPGEQRTHKKTHKYVLYIQMQLCLKTLQDYMRSRGDTIDIPSALRLFSQIARGMQFVHEKGLIHRDLKPA